MNKEVLITIEDHHEIDGEKEGLEMTTLGTIEGDGDNYILRYSESGDFDGCDVSLEVKNRCMVTMTRAGAFETQLIIEKGERHNCCYETPAGELMLGVFAKDVTSSVEENGGTLTLDYTLDFNAGLISENYLVITVKNI